ncbi:C13 family peptidase [Chitinibacteraceae bacterium HSL-7]
MAALTPKLAIRTLLLRRIDPASWPSSAAWFIACAFAVLCVQLAVGYWRTEGQPAFDHYALPAMIAPFLWLLLLGLAVPRAPAHRLALIWLTFQLALMPILLLVEWLVRTTGNDMTQWYAAWALYLGALLWGCVALARQLACSMRRSGAIILALLCAAGIFLYSSTFRGLTPWYDGSPLADEQDAPTPIDERVLLLEQRERLDEALARIPANRGKQTQTYAIAVAGNGIQQVFRNEASAVLQALAPQTGKRTLLLANGDAFAPLATRPTLDYALEKMASKMKPDDRLVLYMTSHGGEAFDFQLNLPGLEFDPITPQWLAATLSRHGLMRRMVIVSACYSGGYVTPLLNEHSAVMTAADAKHTSFGCSDDATYTYFGHALLRALPESSDWQTAFETANREVSARERNEGLTASNPQFAKGRYFDSSWTSAR